MDLDAKIARLTKELERLKAARDVFAEFAAPEREREAAPSPQRKGKLIDAVKQALRELGRGNSAQVIAWLKENWDPQVNSNSVRSTLSTYRGRYFKQVGKKWSLMPEGLDI